MAKGDWFFKFEIPPWRKPKVRSCSLATRGFWLECIAIMRESGKAIMAGTYEDFAKMTGCFPAEAKKCIDELKRYKTADVTLGNKNVTVYVTLKSRKYARELKAKELTKLRVRKLREKENVTHDVTPKKRVSESNKKKEEIKEEEIHIDAPAISDWTWPIKPFVDAFPEYLPDRVTPAMIGFIEGEITPSEINEAAWAATIRDYQMNFDPMRNRYLPDKIANVLSVFRKHKAEAEGAKNGSKKPNTGRRDSKNDSQSTNDYLASIGAKPKA